jgi:hypothetical protein
MFGDVRGRTNEGLPESIQFENAVISDGTVVYRDARTGSEDKLEGINGRFAAEGIYGPLRAVGELHYGDVPLRFSISTGRFDPRGQANTPIKFTTELRGEARGLTRTQPVLGSGNFMGTVRFADSGAQLKGQVKLNGEDLTDFLASLGLGSGLPGVFAQKFSIDSGVELKDQVMTANNVNLQLGETRAQGGVNAVFTGDEPQVDVALTVGRVDFDAWRAAADKKAAASKNADDKANAEPEEFILPVAIGMTLDVNVDAVTYRGGAARQLKLAAEMSDGVVDIHQFSVQLPGATDASFNGKLLAVEGYARLDGQAEMASDDFRSLLGWLNMDISGLPAGRLNKVSATSHLALTRDTLDLGDLDLRFDATRLTGAMVAALRERPALGINLIVDQINLDSYIPPAVAEAAQVAATEAARGAMPLTVLTAFDANMRLSVGRLEKGGTTVRNATLDGTLLNGVLNVRKLAIANLAGGAVTLSGTLDGFKDKPRANLAFDVNADEPSDLLRLVGVTLPLPEDAIKPFAARGKITGQNAAYTIDGTVNASVMALSLKGNLALPANAPATFAFDLGVQHPSYVGFVRLFDPDFAPEAQADARAVDLTAHLESKGKNTSLTAIRGALGPVTVDGDSSITFDGALPHLTAHLSAGDLDTRNFLAPEKAAASSDEHWSTAPIELDAARFMDAQVTINAKSLHHGDWTIADPKAELALGNGGIELKRLAGEMLGGQFDLRARLMPTGQADAAMALNYQLSLAGAELGQSVFDNPRGIDLSGGRADLTIEGQGAGTSEAAILAGMSGKGSLTMQNTVLKGFDLARLNARYTATENPGELVRLIQSSMASGATRVTSLNGDFDINNGVIAFDDLLIQSSAGNVRALVAADLPHWRLDVTASVRLAAESRAPTFDMTLAGPLNAPKRDFDSDALQAFILEESARRAPAARPAQPQPPRSAPPVRQAPPTSANQPPPTSSAPAQTLPSTPPAQTLPSRLTVPQTRNAPTAQPENRPVPQMQPTSPGAPASQAPRVLSVSPNASSPATGSNGPSQPPEPYVPGSRTLSISPNAAKPESPVPGARVLSVSPNAARPAAPAEDSQSQGAPITSQPLPAESNAGAPPAAQPSQPPQQPPTQDPDSFARDVLRGLQQP